jgi:hypothetical protein
VIISKQLIICVQQAKTSKEGEVLVFHIASYLLYVICAINVFVGMNLSWHVAELPVHVCFSILWENRYKKYYALICDELISHIHFIVFKKECSRLSTTAKKMVAKVGQWYLDECLTYIMVFGATRAPHLLLAHVPYQLIVGEICYQTILHGYNAMLVKDKKRDFKPYSFHVGFYLVKDIAQAKQEGLSQLEFRFPTGRFHKHDPKGLVLQHASQVSSCWPYVHDKFKDEIFTECA